MTIVATASELVQYIAWLSRQRDVRLSKIRLVKFLYLADLAHARSHEGRTLTGWPWFFRYFGPYCAESAQAIEAAVADHLVEARPYQSPYDDEDRFTYEYDDEDEPRTAKTLPLEVSGFLQSLMRRFGDDTPALLDYVYFETEPMINARPGQLLDFALARRPEHPRPVEMAKLSRRSLRHARELIEQMRKRDAGLLAAARKPDRGWYDAAYLEAVAAMEGKGIDPFGGSAVLRERNSDEDQDR
jgi:hypothetical protein